MQVVDFIEEIIDSLDFTYKIEESQIIGDDTEIEVCELFHARPGLVVIESNTEFIIKSVDFDAQTILITGLPNVSNPIVLQSPFYFHGTPYAQGEVLSLIDKWEDKIPFIYALEIMQEKIDIKKTSRIENEPNIVLFFMDNANYADWSTDEHYSFRVKPQRRLVDKFMDKFSSHRLVGNLDNYSVINHVKFGVYVTNKGHTNSLLNERLSGAEVRFTPQLLKDLLCKNNGKC